MQKSMDSLTASLKSLVVFDAAYWNTQKELADLELVRKKFQLKEDKAEHLEEGRSLTDSAWRSRMRLYEAEEDSIQRTIIAAREEPLNLLKLAQQQAASPQQVTKQTDQAYVEIHTLSTVKTSRVPGALSMTR